MLRLACLLLSLSGASTICASADAAAGSPASRSADAADAADCKAKVSPPTVAAKAVPAETPARGADGATADRGTVSGGRVRSPSSRWNRLLPGMFR